MNELKLFDFEDHPIRAIRRADGVWWVLADVCDALDIGNPSQAKTRLEADEWETLTVNEGLINQGLSGNNLGTEINIISRPGFFHLVGSSKKPEAKRMVRWMNHEVLPKLMDTGTYSMRPQSHLDTAKMLVASLEREEALKKQVGDMTADVETLHTIVATAESLIPREAAKLIDVSPKQLTDFLYARENEWCFPGHDGPLPYQPKVDAGLLAYKFFDWRKKEYHAEYAYGRRPQVCITMDGVSALRKIFGTDQKTGTEG